MRFDAGGGGGGGGGSRFEHSQRKWKKILSVYDFDETRTGV